ncbi:hypothetical protein SAMN05216257_103121 [Meinhardsimonia xiamenensis]|uniref:Response regulatory domain-containing protein n=1 Tax=Meinhardsimonia xiamenensis TaxID=990712 RepID=A0A1G9CI48_9RHOB|nr:hypothetical protein [Meinhardsimonia xiamenensis]PRX38351.1 hypothetical protein LV81_00633 [Meinhardsimonia xiamenensis]SDK51361.1 hypothetical protein SAMN05216257_103121 [Meinhardsimonia xiamenensis]
MHALILDDDCRRQLACSMALMRKGFQAGCAASYHVAESCIRRGNVDVLILPERLRGRLTHSLALLAEWRNPAAATIMLSERQGPEAEELHLLLPSLHALMPGNIRPAELAHAALDAVTAAARRAASGGRLVLEEHLRIDPWPHCRRAQPVREGRAPPISPGADHAARPGGAPEAAQATAHDPQAEAGRLLFTSCRRGARAPLVTAA